MGWISKLISTQMADNSSVVAEHRWSPNLYSFFLNSPAGLIRYKPKDQRDAARFRDKWINRFEAIKTHSLDQKDLKIQMIFLYREIRKNEKVSFKANLHTRLRGGLCFFKLSF
jgi:hypothetical protein